MPYVGFQLALLGTSPRRGVIHRSDMVAKRHKSSDGANGGDGYKLGSSIHPVEADQADTPVEGLRLGAVKKGVYVTVAGPNDSARQFYDALMPNPDISHDEATSVTKTTHRAGDGTEIVIESSLLLEMLRHPERFSEAEIDNALEAFGPEGATAEQLREFVEHFVMVSRITGFKSMFFHVPDAQATFDILMNSELGVGPTFLHLEDHEQGVVQGAQYPGVLTWGVTEAPGTVKNPLALVGHDDGPAWDHSVKNADAEAHNWLLAMLYVRIWATGAPSGKTLSVNTPSGLQVEFDTRVRATLPPGPEYGLHRIPVNNQDISLNILLRMKAAGVPMPPSIDNAIRDQISAGNLGMNLTFAPDGTHSHPIEEAFPEYLQHLALAMKDPEQTITTLTEKEVMIAPAPEKAYYVRTEENLAQRLLLPMMFEATSEFDLLRAPGAETLIEMLSDPRNFEEVKARSLLQDQGISEIDIQKAMNAIRPLKPVLAYVAENLDTFDSAEFRKGVNEALKKSTGHELPSQKLDEMQTLLEVNAIMLQKAQESGNLIDFEYTAINPEAEKAGVPRTDAAYLIQRFTAPVEEAVQGVFYELVKRVCITEIREMIRTGLNAEAIINLLTTGAKKAEEVDSAKIEEGVGKLMDKIQDLAEKTGRPDLLNKARLACGQFGLTNFRTLMECQELAFKLQAEAAKQRRSVSHRLMRLEHGLKDPFVHYGHMAKAGQLGQNPAQAKMAVKIWTRLTQAWTSPRVQEHVVEMGDRIDLSRQMAVKNYRLGRLPVSAQVERMARMTRGVQTLLNFGKKVV